jgi:glutaminyl-peptide cyclotransferase
MRVFVCALGALIMLLMSIVPSETAATPPFDGGKAYEHLRNIVAFGPRPPGSAPLAQTRKYLQAELATLGVTVVEQAFDADTPMGQIKMVNVRAVIPGASKERLVIGGHYDTKLFKQFRFVGANDAGSSTAFLLELARVLRSRQNPFTIELVFFDGEEAFVDWAIANDHTYGSRYYVDEARRTGQLKSIKAMILVDMIGDRHLNIRRETASTKWMTDAIWDSARTLGYGRYFLDEELTVEDDHVAFLAAGVPAVDIIDLDYQPWHTAGDTIDQVSARSMETVGRVLVDALTAIEARLGRSAGLWWTIARRAPRPRP